MQGASSLDQNRVAKHGRRSSLRGVQAARDVRREGGGTMGFYGRGKGAPRADGGRRKEEKGREEGGKEKRDGVTVYTLTAIRCGAVRYGAVRQARSEHKKRDGSCVHPPHQPTPSRSSNGWTVDIDRSRRAWTSTRADRCFLPPARPSGRLRPRRAETRMRHIARE